MNERKTASAELYMIMHTKNIHKECPGSIYDRTKFISITIMEEDSVPKNFFLRDIVYLPLEEAYKKYIENEVGNYPEPYENLPVVYIHLLKERILSQMVISSVDQSLDVNECFEKFKEGKEEKNERILLDNKMHFDDNLIDWQVPSELNLRDVAENIIKKSQNGSWLIRRSSVKEQDYVKVRVITCISSDRVIKNFLFVHINGFGYVLIDGVRGQAMPKLGEDKTIKIQTAFYSLPDALSFLRKEGLSLSQIIV